jgi:UDP-glucose 4-epimerase
MDILVTGGAGYIGSGILVKLGQRFPNASVTSIDNLALGDYSYVNHLRDDKRYRLLVGDIGKKSDLQKAFAREPEFVIHVAAMPGVKLCEDQPKQAIDSNFYGTHLLLEKSVNHNVKRFIFTSSAAVYGVPQEQPISEDHPLKPVNLYGVTKEAAEKTINATHANHGLTTTIFRLSNVYGLSVYTRQKTVIPKFVWQATSNQPLTIRADGEQERNFVHVQDVIDAIIKCLEAPEKAVAGETLNIGGESRSVNQIAEIVIQEAKEKLDRKISKVFTPLNPGEVYTHEFGYSYKRAAKKIDYKPRRKIPQGVSELFNYTTNIKGELRRDD